MAKRLLLAFLIAILVRVAPAWAEGDFRRNLPPINVPRYEVPERNVQGMWWASPAGSESGWGLHIAHQGSTLFINLFAYDTDGTALWLTASNVFYDKYSGRHSGRLYRATGPAFSDTPWDPAKVRLNEVGGVNFTATGSDTGLLEYTFSGVVYRKNVTRYAFSLPAPTCRWVTGSPTNHNYTDLWWHSPPGSQPGWGVTVAHQGDTLFASWYTYRADGKGEWIMMANGTRMADGSFSGTLHRAHGPPANPVKFDASRVSLAVAGTATFTFAGNGGRFAYTLDGVTQSKPITRFTFSSPLTVCSTP